MVLAKLFGIASLTGYISALTPPKGLNDGSYRAYIDHLGREVHELVALPNGDKLDSSEVTQFVTDENALKTLTSRADNFSPDRKTISKRYYESSQYGFGDGILDIYCGCGFNLDPGNCDAAVADLKNQVGSDAQIPMNMAWYSIRGNVVAFACTRPESIDNYNKPSDSDANYLTISYEDITHFCGWYVAGTAMYVPFWATEYNQPYVEYMQYYDGLDFCYQSTGSSEDHC
ncbi:hypothetical protein BGW36DRAFT_364573 [Talaromyces proteolyticus]|uniref:Uncharacterized protein n=1 Tax=Talaromyces proteolyticus TaxID=1131652 RepID=A0AAD4PSX0_9EURO|nr:uncharacterized protein BGW36DRAFT_364573 [Talaromyces proteolyticus]KAH8689829.1 hypothetical protein BGW36DRAFT_364573 [Talaromyces proteolyticus]